MANNPTRYQARKALEFLIEDVAAQLQRAEQAERERDAYQALINDDGSLETHEDHLDILRDAMHHLHIAPQMAEQIDMLRRERDALAAKLQRLKEGT